MLVESLFALLTLLCSAALSASPPSNDTHSPAFNWNQIDYVYSFGDSYSFVPGAFGETGFSFIGSSYRFSFTPEELYTNRILPNKTSSGGSNWLQYLTRCFEGHPATCPKQLWSFAHGGADIDGSLLPLRRDTSLQLNDQVRQWLEYASYIIPKPPGRTIVGWWMGINDCSHGLNNATITDHDAFLDADMETYFKLVDITARNGMRTHLFLTVPPVDRSQYAKTVRGGPQAHKAMIDLFNKKLLARLDKFKKDNPDLLILTFDAAKVFTDILDHPQQYGFNDTVNFCTNCENQEVLFWHNDEHPTEHVHRILAKELEDFLQNPGNHS